jgi:serine/threonine-protein kinase
VKPDNLYITWSGEDGDFVKVLDFGVAKEYQKAGELKVTQTGAVIGTPEYMSPEVARGEALNLTGARNIYQYRYDSSYQDLLGIMMLPAVPTLGFEAQF